MRISDWSSDVCSSDLVAEGIVDALEVVDVREQQRHLPRRAAHQHQLLVEVFAESQSVRQPGQRVGVGHAVDVADRKRVEKGKSVSVSVDLGGRRYIKKNNTSN